MSLRSWAAASAVGLAFLGSAPSDAADNLYRPLTKTQFDRFDAEYWSLSKCQGDFLKKSGIQPEELAARIEASGRLPELVKLASELLPTDDPMGRMLRDTSLDPMSKVRTAMAGLGLYGGRADLLPSQGMRAFGVVREFMAIGTAPACQPSQEFLSNLKVMINEHF